MNLFYNFNTVRAAVKILGVGRIEAGNIWQGGASFQIQYRLHKRFHRIRRISCAAGERFAQHLLGRERRFYAAGSIDHFGLECLAGAVADFHTLPELVASFGRLGCDVVEMVLADQDGWDRYEAAKWLTMRRWLEAHPDDELAGEVRAKLTSEPARYAAYTREYLGWGVFALMLR